jgi:hypothetical protein
MAQLIQWNQINVDDITFGAPKSLDSGGKFIGLYHNKKNLVFQTPPLVAPYGLGKWPQTGPVNKYSLDLSINNPEFLNILKQLDEKIVNTALASSVSWFKKKINTCDVIEALYTNIVKYSKDPEAAAKYPPVVKFNLPYKNGKFECEAYNEEREQIDMETAVTKRTTVTAIVQCSSLWVAGDKFGCTFKVLQMKVLKNNESISGYAFVDEDQW